MSDKTLYVKEQNCHPSTPDSRLALCGGTKGRAVLNSAPAEEVILTARSRATRQREIGPYTGHRIPTASYSQRLSFAPS